MPDSPHRVRIEGIDWVAAAPVLKLVRSFRMALQPGKLLLALAAVLILFGVGELMDLAWGDVAELPDGTEVGVYEATMQRQGQAFSVLMKSALALDLGLDTVGAGRPTGVAGAMWYMTVETPRWLFTNHPWFAIVFGLVKLLVLGLFGGAICRMAATQACVGQLTSAIDALRYTSRRIVWFVATPLMPCVLIAVLAGVLALAGLVFFNVPGLDLVGAVLFGLLLVLGLLAALVAIGLVLGWPLMVPCLAVEGTDGFDAVSRCYNYVFFRPWHYAFYLVSMAVFAAVSYLAVVAVASGTVYLTDSFVGAGSFVVVEDLPIDDATRYDAIEQQVQYTNAGLQDDADDLEGTLGASAWVVTQWVRLVWAIVAAFMVSLFFCMLTWVYLLLRSAADATPMDDCDTGDGDVLWAADETNDAPASTPAEAADA